MSHLKKPMVSIIVPVYNEEGNLDHVLNNLFQVVNNDLIVRKEWRTQIIIVDDGSTDKSVKIIKNLINDKSNIHFLQHYNNKGKGAAISTALKSAKGDFCIIQDADLEYDPSEISMLLEPLIKGKYDVVYGSRFLQLKNYNGLWLNLLGNKFLSMVGSFLIQRHISDIMTCYKAFRRVLLQNVSSRSFEVEPEITAKLLLNRSIRFREYPISYKPRLDGKKIKKIDGFISLFRLVITILIIQKKNLFRDKASECGQEIFIEE